MRKNKLLLLLALLMTAATGAWAQDYEEAYTFQTAYNASNTAYASTYDVTIDEISWNVPGNHKFTGYVRIGGKSLDGVDRIIKSNGTISDDISKITFNHNGVNSDKLTVNSIKLTVASNSDFSTVIEEITKTPTVAKSTAGSFDFVAGEADNTVKSWGEGRYYKFTLNLTNSMSSNYGIDVTSIVFYKATASGGASSTYSVTMKDGVKDADKWTITPNEGLKEGDAVTLTYSGRLKVKGVKATSDAVPVVNIVDLSKLTQDTELQDGDVVTGTLDGAKKITIADGATVTLDGVTINGVHSDWYQYAGITCLGDATIILKDGTTNTVEGFDGAFPGIQGAAGKTLTIKGTGSLNASCDPNGGGAGIGSGSYSNYNPDRACGDIVIEGGTITAVGGYSGAGIGSGMNSSCGNITIKSTVAHVTATKGSGAPDSIGAGKNGSCGTKTIEDASKVTEN